LLSKSKKPWPSNFREDTQFAALHSEYVALTKMLLRKSGATGGRSKLSVSGPIIAEGAAEGTAVCNMRSPFEGKTRS